METLQLPMYLLPTHEQYHRGEKKTDKNSKMRVAEPSHVAWLSQLQ